MTTTEQRTPVAVPNSMPGRYKSCRRSPSELFSKEQEQELQKCAQSEVFMKEEQEQEKLQEPSPKKPEVTPPNLTPLRWRSSSMKKANGVLEVSNSVRPAEDPIQIHPGCTRPGQEVRHAQSVKRPSQAQLRAQVMNSLSLEQARNDGSHVQQAEPTLEPVVAPDGAEHTPQNGVLNSAEPAEVNASERRELSSKSPANPGVLNPPEPEESANVSERGELSPEFPTSQGESAGNSTMPEEQGNASEGIDVVAENSTNGGSVKTSLSSGPPTAEPVEEVIFQPVDLDKKYREKELVRHVTAAKIQNREEALLNNPSPPGLNGRKVSVGEEPAAMTIEFLRARLQAERSASRATKLRMEQLSKKVTDLESRLSTEVELRKSAETALQDALSKLKQAIPQLDRGIQQGGSSLTSGSPNLANASARTNGEMSVSQIDEKTKVEHVKSKSVSLGEKVLECKSPVMEEKETSRQEGSARVGGDQESPSTTREISGSKEGNEGGLWRDRSVVPQHPGTDPLQAVSTKGSQDSGSGSSPERARTPSRQRQEIRAAIEERLRSMWAKIGEEMAALAEVRGEEDIAKKDVKEWMGQPPIVLQNKQSSRDTQTSTNLQQYSSEGHLSVSNQQTGANVNEAVSQEQTSSKVAATAEKHSSLRRNVSLAKNVAKLVEQYEFQETAQREWEESFEAQQLLEPNEDEVPELVTRNGDVFMETDSDPRVLLLTKGRMARSQSQGERNLKRNGPISRSKSLGFLPSQKGAAPTNISQKVSSDGQIEILTDDPIETEGGDEELLFDPEMEMAEELPNGIYLHHSRDDVDSHRRGGKDSMYRKTTERVGSTERVAAADDIISPSKSDRAPHSRERFIRSADSPAEGDQQGWPVREIQDRASCDMYYDPIINNRSTRVDAHYSNPEREFLHRSRTIPERVSDDIYRSGPRREVQGVDRIQRQEERRFPPRQYPYPSSEEGPGMHYGYRDRDHLEQDVQYRNTFRHREDGHRGMATWQEGSDGGLRNRGASQNHFGYPPPYVMEDPQQAQYTQPSLYSDTTGYNGRRDMHYIPHVANNSRPDYYPPSGIPGPRPSSNAHVTPDGPPISQGYPSWDGIPVHGEQRTASGVSEDVPGEASEVLKALRIAKQQIKSSTVEQAAFMTAQYTVSQEHRYGAGGQVSKTSYTVEAPVGYPRVTKTFHEGWHLEGGKASSKKRGGFVGSNGVGIDLAGTNVTDLITGTGPLTVTNGEGSYVEKLNVGQGIQFFFAG